jgi:hypothetical protein
LRPCNSRKTVELIPNGVRITDAGAYAGLLCVQEVTQP